MRRGRVPYGEGSRRDSGEKIVTSSEDKTEQAAVAELMNKLDLSDVLNLSAQDFRVRCLQWIRAFKAKGRTNPSG